MNTVNVSRSTGWIRLALSVASFGALGLALYYFVVNHDTVYWNLGSGSHVHFYAFLVLYGVTFLAAIVGVISGVTAVRSPGKSRGWILNVVLIGLLALTLWTCPVILNARVFLDS